MKKSRRKFLKDSGLITAGITLASNNATASLLTSHNSVANDIVVCIFQRGGADGLHSVVPHQEPLYFQQRPELAVSDSIDLDGFFGLNQNLSALKSIWDAGDLGIVHAVGNKSDSRSHFNAQDQMEYASENNNTFREGWLSKYLTNTISEDDTVFRSVSLNQSIQKSIKGEVESLTISDLRNFDVYTDGNIYEQTVSSLDSLYQNDEHFIDTKNVLFTAIDVLKSIDPEDYPVDNGADYKTTSFANRLRSLGIIIKADLGTQIACVDIGGWDHHNALDEVYPELATEFAEGLQAFYQDMGDRMQNITILCMTEFGRRVEENASLGTDHGHAGVMYAIGKQVNGGEVYSDWPGLEEENLNRGDLEVTTDFREVFAELLVKRLKYQDNLENIISDYNYQGGIGLFKTS